MPVLSTALIIGGIASGVGGVASAVIGSKAAGKAAATQSSAALSAAELTKQAADDSLAFQKEIWETQQQQQAPFLAAGQGAIGQLAAGTQPGGQFMQTFGEEFKAPGADFTQDPGYQFRLAEGQKILERSAASRGNLLTGGTAKALERYGQDFASNEYGNVYNRALGEYQQNYNIFQQNQANQFNRLGALAGMGQVSANQLGAAGSDAARGVSSINFNAAQGIGNAMQNAAAARASGYINSANQWGGAIGNLGNLLNQGLLLSSPEFKESLKR